MAYGYATADIDRVRSKAGNSTNALVRITSPALIAGSSVTVIWDTNDAVADTYRVTIGTTAGGTEIADSGYVQGISSHTFISLTYTTETAYITLYYRLGAGPAKAVGVNVPIELTEQPPVVSPDPDLNWNDSLIWDDNRVWVE